ncbi:SAM-dependent methyltransferase [Streptomyces sp. CRN 30]|uniref:class I SAM-dependent methyltransferase n=1 Tax=Streptomyces sp. CRN 30 TaxID=3075613 RepID=UPI002A833FAC|nr:SAM-dependent methyltransferase [Streptomyces sp. CRN 30]
MTGHLVAVERTALLTAALRAAETAREDRLYEDPYAARLAGEEGMQLLMQIREASHPKSADADTGTDRDLPSTPDYNAIRTRFLDDFLRRAAQDPAMRQIVLAPAGLDSRAHRLDWPSHIRYFEVDRPAVLAHKEERLKDVEPRVDLRTIAVDLTAPDWEQELIAAGYDPEQPSTWLLEGLLYYLTGDDTHRILDRVAALMDPGSRIAADLVNEAALTSPDMRGLLDVFAGWDCPWLFGTDEPEALFAAHGFTVEATQPGEPAADHGRWPDPVPDRSVTGVRRVFFVHGRRS